jgi:uncharacterized repeat protein (TIGR01451 family)/LPXTG-motif cell wall-anchored protein
MRKHKTKELIATLLIIVMVAMLGLNLAWAEDVNERDQGSGEQLKSVAEEVYSDGEDTNLPGILGGKSGTTLTAKITGKIYREITTNYDWAISKTSDENSIEIAPGETKPVQFTVTATRSEGETTDRYRIRGKVTVKNEGAVATENLTIVVQLRYKAGSGQFQDLAGASTTIPTAELQPHTTGVYDYDLPFTPVEGAQYKVVARVRITNHSGSPGTPKGPGSDSPDGGPAYDLTVPTNPSVSHSGDTAQVSDVLDCPEGFSCNPDTIGPWTFADTDSKMFTVDVTNVSAPANAAYTLTNTAILTAAGKEIRDSATVNISVPAQPSILLTKVASQKSAKLNDTIKYTYTITNTGNVTLTNIQLTDDKIEGISLSKTILAPGETIIAFATMVGTVEGELTNTATVTGEYGDKTVDDTATATVNITDAQQPSISLTKTASPTTAVIGEKITYTYTITNTGNVTLSNITLFDNKILWGWVHLPKITLEPGETMTATAMSSGIFEGTLTNKATVTGWYGFLKSVTDTATASVTITKPQHGILLTKTAPETAKIGDEITYTYTIKNIGDVKLYDIKLTDDKIGNITLPKTKLDPNEEITVTVTTVVKVEDVVDDKLTNVATVTGKYKKLLKYKTVTDTATATVLINGNGVTDPESGNVKIIKTAVEDTPVFYTMNNSESAGEPLAGAVFVIKNSDGEVVDTLTTGDDGTITSKDLPYGKYAVIETEAPEGYILDSMEREATIDAENTLIELEFINVKMPEWLGRIRIVKTVTDNKPTNGVSVMNSTDSPGEGFKFKLTGENLNKPMEAKTDEFGEAEFPELLAGTYYLSEELRTDYYTYDIPEGGLEIILAEDDEDLDDGVVKIVDITNIYDPEEPPTPQPGISLTKTASPTRVKVGGKVTYTFVIKNTGDLPLFDVTLYDDQLDETFEVGDLEEGEAVTITKEYTTRTTGILVNNAEVKGYYDEGVYVTDKDDASVEVYRDSGGGKNDDKPDKPKKPEEPEKPEEPIEVPEEPIPQGPAIPEKPEPPVEIIVQEEPVPTAPAKELPKTGGNPIALILSGIMLAGVGLVIRRKS